METRNEDPTAVEDVIGVSLHRAITLMSDLGDEPVSTDEYYRAMLPLLTQVRNRALTQPENKDNLASFPGKRHLRKQEDTGPNLHRSIRVMMHWLSIYMDRNIHTHENTREVTWLMETYIIVHAAKYGGTCVPKNMKPRTGSTLSSMRFVPQDEEEEDEEEVGLVMIEEHKDSFDCEAPDHESTNINVVLSDATLSVQEFTTLHKEYQDAVKYPLDVKLTAPHQLTPDHGQLEHVWETMSTAAEEDPIEDAAPVQPSNGFDYNGGARLRSRPSPYNATRTRDDIDLEMMEWDQSIRKECETYDSTNSINDRTRSDEKFLIHCMCKVLLSGVSMFIVTHSSDPRLAGGGVSRVHSAAASCPKPYAMAKGFAMLSKVLCFHDCMYVIAVLCHVWDVMSRTLRQQTAHPNPMHWVSLYSRMTQLANMGRKLIETPREYYLRDFYRAIDLFIYTIANGPEKERFFCGAKSSYKPFASTFENNQNRKSNKTSRRQWNAHGSTRNSNNDDWRVR
jgi:hypothetical protein